MDIIMLRKARNDPCAVGRSTCWGLNPDPGDESGSKVTVRGLPQEWGGHLAIGDSSHSLA